MPTKDRKYPLARQTTQHERRGRGRPRNTWKRYLQEEMRTACFRYSWRKMEATAQDRAGWSQVIYGVCSTGINKA